MLLVSSCQAPLSCMPFCYGTVHLPRFADSCDIVALQQSCTAPAVMPKSRMIRYRSRSATRPTKECLGKDDKSNQQPSRLSTESKKPRPATSVVGLRWENPRILAILVAGGGVEPVTCQKNSPKGGFIGEASSNLPVGQSVLYVFLLQLKDGGNLYYIKH